MYATACYDKWIIQVFSIILQKIDSSGDLSIGYKYVCQQKSIQQGALEYQLLIKPNMTVTDSPIINCTIPSVSNIQNYQHEKESMQCGLNLQLYEQQTTALTAQPSKPIEIVGEKDF